MSAASFIVIEAGPPGAAARICAELAAGGVRIAQMLDQAGPGVAYTALVGDEPAAQRAVLAALSGAHLVLTATAPREVIDRMCDDLRRLGTLDHRVGDPADGRREVVDLGDTERALLARLLAGDSLGQAAAALHLSRRTADRRLAVAKRALGAATTAEALAIAVRIGLLPG